MQVGSQRQFSFAVRDHLAVAEALDLVDFETAAEVCVCGGGGRCVCVCVVVVGSAGLCVTVAEVGEGLEGRGLMGHATHM